MITPETLPYIAAAVGLALGTLLTWLLMAPRSKAQSDIAAEKILAAYDRNEQVTHDLETLRNQYETLTLSENSMRKRCTELEVRLQEEKKSATEKHQMLERAEGRLSDTFKALSAEALKSTQDQFLSLAKNSLRTQQKEASSELEKRQVAVEEMVKPISQTLEKVQSQITESEKLREGDKATLTQQILHITETNLGLQKETQKLVKALRQPTGRGQWGEMQLRRVVEMAGMQEHCDFKTQTTTTTDEGKRLRPDLVVKLPGGQQVVVDSKAPMDAYLDAIEAESDELRATAMARHAAQVRTHVQQLSSKNYQAQFDTTPEFVVLFLPSEAFFSAALAEDSSLIEKGVDQGVILATPTTLIALLRAVSFGWRQEALADNAKEISDQGRRLYERLSVFAGHLTSVGKNLETTVTNFNKAVGSFESKIVPAARKFEELGAAPEQKKLPKTSEIEKITRSIHTELTPSQQLTRTSNHTSETTGKANFPIAETAVSEGFGFEAFTEQTPSNQPDIRSAADDLRSAFE